MSDKSKRDIVSDWRAANIEELDNNLRVWKSIRDDPDASDRDRTEAAKSIARQLGALSPDTKDKGREVTKPSAPKLKSDHSAELDSLLEGLK